MKVYIEYNKNPSTGKGFFLNRLRLELLNQGVDIVSDNPDVALSPIKIVRNFGSKTKHVVRLDGIYHNTGMNYKSRNKSIAKEAKKGDAIVYQSKFGKQMCDKYLGINLPSSTILNGVELNFYDNIKPKTDLYENSFFAVSRWRPHKRLLDIIKSFQLANIQNSGLYIAGDISKSGIPKERFAKILAKNKNIKHIGKVSQECLASYYLACKASIHLCWFDCCPNSVVEAVGSGSIVITNNVGGTREIVEPSGGIVCNIDKKYDLNPVKLYSPPTIDHNVIAQQIIRASTEYIKINRDHVDIKTVAKQYKEFFRKLL